MTSSSVFFQNLRKTALVNILESICDDFHQHRFSPVGCRADTHTHTRTQTYRHPQLDSNIFSQNEYKITNRLTDRQTKMYLIWQNKEGDIQITWHTYP